MKTSRWPVIVLFAYLLVNLVVVYGISWVIGVGKDRPIEFVELLPFALIVCFVMLICQVFLFDVKVDVVEKRPVPKRKITTASIAVALLMAFLTFTAFLLIVLVIFGEDRPFGEDVSEGTMQLILILLFFGSWFFWAYGFLILYKEGLPGDFIRKMIARVMAGSILELLIAIPSHIIFRQRGDCCAPIFSYFGIIAGTTVLLFAFGPGIVFLYLKRMQDKRPRSKDVLDN